MLRCVCSCVFMCVGVYCVVCTCSSFVADVMVSAEVLDELWLFLGGAGVFCTLLSATYFFILVNPWLLQSKLKGGGMKRS